MIPLLVAAVVTLAADSLWSAYPDQNVSRVNEIAAMLPTEPGFPP